jgi:hypothetical protein
MGLWDDNIKLDLRGMGKDNLNCIQLFQNRTNGGFCEHVPETETGPTV